MTNLSTKMTSKWGNLKNYLYKHYGQESGKMIVHAGLITWTTATLGQIAAVVFNKKIDSDQKKFLIPQEILDGAINILAFYTITASMKAVASRLVSTGKWSNQVIRDFVKKNPKGVKMGELSTNLAKTYKENDEFIKAYAPFKNGLEMIATTTGSVVSANVIAPYIRNPLSAKEQKRSIAREQRKNVYPSTGMKI